MNIRTLLLSIVLLSSAIANAQGWQEKKLAPSPKSVASGVNSTADQRIVSSTRGADGYIVYKQDTIKGLILLSKGEVYVETRAINSHKSQYYTVLFKDRDLKTIMMYNNKDKRPLCLTRVQPSDNQLMRLLHEGKLNVYDDRIAYVYSPADIDPNLIVVSYNGQVDNLGSFTTEGTRKDLIAYINDVYGLKMSYRTHWHKVLRTMDGLD